MVSDENIDTEIKFSAIQDHNFSDWLMKQYALACKREHRWKTHLDKSHGVYEYQTAIRMKRCIRECAAYEDQEQVFNEAVTKVANILGHAMDRNELAPSTYQAVMDALNRAERRR